MSKFLMKQWNHLAIKPEIKVKKTFIRGWKTTYLLRSFMKYTEKESNRFLISIL